VATRITHTQEQRLMHITSEGAHVLAAPERLVTETRLEFRRTALEHVERTVQEARPRIYVDLSAIREIDASGLGVLVLIQKRARERMIATRLMHAGAEVRSMLLLTKLDYLFELED
jgi:anti-anti-sigma factor